MLLMFATTLLIGATAAPPARTIALHATAFSTPPQPTRTTLTVTEMSAVTGDGWLEAIIGMIEAGPVGAVLGFVIGLNAEWVCVDYADGSQQCYQP